MTRPVVLVTQRVFPETLELLNARFQVIANRDEEPLPQEELLRLASGADAMLAFMTDRVDAGFLDGMSAASGGSPARSPVTTTSTCRPARAGACG
ncbi:MAG: hypothetical protein RML56_11615 [Burkholderiales bacterium]|nr:hypothetical protein [Burkholderiales bacterium]